ncbi:MAG: leucine-rich repeat domain-containing protein [Muribaculaceae bacterium]|nr:leucine-rich repeat domain-containing protein [Muribaculaceae bacterium]
MKKKILLLMLGALFSLPAFTQDFSIEYSWGTLNFTITDENAKECEVSSSENISGDVEIPKDVIYHKNGNDEGELYRITQIGVVAFDQCTGMTSVTIPENVESIGLGAFSQCTGLTSVTIPRNVSMIGERVFQFCSNLEEILVEEGNKSYCSEGGVLYDIDKTTLLQFPGAKTECNIPEGVHTIGKFAFYCSYKLTSVTIPESVTEIDSGAFWLCIGLTSVTIPGSVEYISDGAFYGCEGLTSVIISEGVKVIDGAFSRCDGLTSVTIPASVTRLIGNPFVFCSNLEEILVEEGNKHYCSEGGVVYDFYKTTLIACPGAIKEYNFPSTVMIIDGEAFDGCNSMTSITIPASEISIPYNIFGYCKNLEEILVEDGNKQYCSENGILYDIDKTILIACPGAIKECNIPNSVTVIGGLAFSNCINMKSITIPSNVKSIDTRAFEGSELNSVTIPEGVESIGYGAFYVCRSLTSVIIPESVTEIGEYAFWECISLGSVTYLADQPIEGDTSIFSSTTYETAMLYMSETGKEASKDIDPWKNFKNVKVYDPASIEENIADFNEDAPCEVFNLNGVKIADSTDNLPAGIYVIRQGNTAKKIAVK